jgi:serine/threonine protein kinase
MPQRIIAGQYELQEALGRGAVGQVWRARDRRLRRMVAVKLAGRTMSFSSRWNWRRAGR